MKEGDWKIRGERELESKNKRVFEKLGIFQLGRKLRVKRKKENKMKMKKKKQRIKNKENLEGWIKINLCRSTSDRNEKYSILSE